MDGRYCCLGVLQKCLTDKVEQRGTPSAAWLSHENIEFADSDGNSAPDGYAVENPYLPYLDDTAAGANDDGVSFVAIADAIKEAVQFPDGTCP